jgi:Mg/Co/Ni transporter MgtE
MTDEEADKIIGLLLQDRDAGLAAFRKLPIEQRKQVIERAQDERINQIVAEADAESITD